MMRRLFVIVGLIGITTVSILVVRQITTPSDPSEHANTIASASETSPLPTGTPNLIARLPIQPLQLQTNTINAIPLNAETLNLYALLWSDDGMRLFAISNQAIITLDEALNTTGGWLVGRLSSIFADLSDDSRLLGVITAENYLRVWETKGGIELGQVRFDNTLNRFEFLPDERIIAGDEVGWHRAYQLTDTGIQTIPLPDTLPGISQVSALAEARIAQHPHQALSATILRANEVAILDESGVVQHQSTLTSIPQQQTIRLAPATNDIGCSILTEEACTR